MITKSLFVKGVTDTAGRFIFRIDQEFADLSIGIWKVKAEQIIIKLQEKISGPISCSVDFCCSPLNGDGVRQPVRLAFCVVRAEKNEFVSLAYPGAEFISFQYPASKLELILRNESSGAVPLETISLPLTPVMAHFIIAREA